MATKVAEATPNQRKLGLLVGKKPTEHSSKVSHAGPKVVVACKLPNGLVMQCSHPTQQKIQGPAGQSVIETIYRKSGPQFVLKGYGVPYDGAGRPPLPTIPKWTFTENIPEDFWNAWLEEHKDSDMVINGLIFAESTLERAKDCAKEVRKTLSGLEPLNPATTVKTVNGRQRAVPVDPRWPTRIKPGTRDNNLGDDDADEEAA